MSRNSTRSSILGGHRGFQQIPETQNGTATSYSPPGQSDGYSPPGNAGGKAGETTIDIPLHPVPTDTSRVGAATNTSASERPMNEKTSPRRGLALSSSRRGRRRGRGPHAQADDSIEGLRVMGRFYDRVLNFSIVTRYFLYILPIGALISLPIIIGATGAQHDPNAVWGGVRMVWIFSWVLTSWVALWVSKLFAKLLPYVFEFLSGIVSAGTRKYSTVIRALELPLSLTGWALASLASFEPIMTNNPDQRAANDTQPKPWEDIMQRILAAFLVSNLIFLGIKLLIQLISISYHRMQYDVKIKDSKHNVHILSVLYDASTALFPPFCPEFAEEDYLIMGPPELGSKTATGHLKTGAATPMRMLATMGRFGDQITTAFGRIAQEVTGKEVFNPTSSHSVVVEALEKRSSSEALAKRLWMSLVVEGKDALYLDDINEVLCEHRQGEALEVFQTLDKDENGDVSLDEMILSVCEIGRERKAIASSLHDVDQAIHVLDNLLSTLAFLICIFVFVAFLNQSFVTTLATAGTALLSLSFVFSATAAEILGSCIFLFVKHPFDVGDRVDIDKQQLVVERISLLYTVFKNVSNHRTRQAPNSVLNALWIDNVSRSKAMRERVPVNISFDTTLEDIQLLRREMQNFVTDKDNNRDFEPDIEVEVTDITKMDHMELTIEIKHKSNWSNEAVRAARRSKFVCALVLALRKVPIYAPGGGNAALGSADQPSYTVSVSDQAAAAARSAYADAKEGKRMQRDRAPSLPMPQNGDFNDSDALGFSTLRGNNQGGKGAHEAGYDQGSGNGPNDFGNNGRSNSSNSAKYGASTGVGTSPDATTLRNRSAAPIAPVAETSAMNELNSRPPASDPAHDWQQPGGSPLADTHGPRISSDDPRRPEIEEVYGMLRRQTTRGKRRESGYGARRSQTYDHPGAESDRRRSSSIPPAPYDSIYSSDYHTGPSTAYPSMSGPANPHTTSRGLSITTPGPSTAYPSTSPNNTYPGNSSSTISYPTSSFNADRAPSAAAAIARAATSNAPPRTTSVSNGASRSPPSGTSASTTARSSPPKPAPLPSSHPDIPLAHPGTRVNLPNTESTSPPSQSSYLSSRAPAASGSTFSRPSPAGGNASRSNPAASSVSRPTQPSGAASTLGKLNTAVSSGSGSPTTVNAAAYLPPRSQQSPASTTHSGGPSPSSNRRQNPPPVALGVFPSTTRGPTAANAASANTAAGNASSTAATADNGASSGKGNNASSSSPGVSPVTPGLPPNGLGYPPHGTPSSNGQRNNSFAVELEGRARGS